jgi:DNA-binding CsgD family transcriptional regulator
MSLRHRPMRPKDVRECVEFVAAHLFVGPRYGNAISDLRPAWIRLLSGNGFSSAIVFEEELDGVAPRILGVGVTVFVSDNFLRELKTPPGFWMGPEIARRVALGDHSPLLSEKEIQEANTQGGLNLAVWHACVGLEDTQRTEVWTELMTTFLDHHRGFLLKELLIQGESPEHLEGVRNTGGFLFRPEEGRYGDLDGRDLRELASQPHIMGLTREMATGHRGSWVGSLFRYEPPQFGFSVSEQRLLLSALAGGTDEELSDDLGISLSSVKKTWRSIYDRVATCLPELIPGNALPDGEASKRGKDKKQRLISYLREHPQELRPVSRKLLQQSVSSGRHSQKDKSA